MYKISWLSWNPKPQWFTATLTWKQLERYHWLSEHKSLTGAAEYALKVGVK